MKVRDLIEKLRDLHGDTEVEICNTASGYKSNEVTAFGVEAGAEKIVLICKDFDYMAQIEAKYRTFSFTGIDRAGKFVTGRASADVAISALTTIEKAVQKADRKNHK